MCMYSHVAISATTELKSDMIGSAALDGTASDWPSRKRLLTSLALVDSKEKTSSLGTSNDHLPEGKMASNNPKYL